MTGPVFAPGERLRVETAVEDGRLALVAVGLWPAAGASLYLHHRRAAVLATRGWIGRKPRHAEVAAASLEWARSRGDVGLYAMVALAMAVEAGFGRDGLDAATAAYPPLEGARAAFDDLVRHLRKSLAGTVSPSGATTSEG